MSEQSGPHLASPSAPPQPAHIVVDRGGAFDLKTIGVWMALALGAGGGMTGVATTLGGSPSRAEIAEVRVALEKVTVQLAEVQRGLDAMRSESRATERDHARFDLVDSDHEKRLRDLEAKRPR